MKNILFTALLFIGVIGYSQTNYSQGFSDGYITGYCYGQGFGCIPPIPPIAPIPLINEDYNNYQQGYNRGLLEGEKKREQKTAENNSSYNNSSQQGGYISGLHAVVSPDIVNNMINSQEKREEDHQADVNNYTQEHYSQTIQLGNAVFKWINRFQEYLLNQPNNDIKTRNLIDKLSTQLAYMTSLSQKLTVNNWNEIREDIISEKDDVEQEVNDYNEEHK